MKIDLNLDAGEDFGLEMEASRWISSFSLSLGAHAGSLEKSLELSRALRAMGKGIGLHPGYPDPVHFGRRSPSAEEEPLWRDSVREQLRAAFPADYVKFHGALYHDTQTDADWIRPEIAALGLPVLGMAGTQHQALGTRGVKEGFCERGYRQGNLIRRGEPGAGLTDLAEIQAQAIRLAAECESICIHGDNPAALEIAEAVFDALVREGYAIEPFAR